MAIALQITANTTAATAQVNNLAGALGNLSAAATSTANATNLVSTANVTAARNAQQAAIAMGAAARSAAATASSMRPLALGANQAGNALQNLGRVAQDAPFGFIGIQNNLNPLLESFQRLRAETGSAGGALRALGSSLLGAGGIGLALSLVSSAIVIYQNGIAGFNKKNKEAKDGLTDAEAAAKKFGEQVKNLSKYQVDYAEASGKGLADLRVLKGVIEDVNKPMDARLQAVKEIQKEFPQYFKGLQQEAILAGAVGRAYELATNSIIRKAKASAATKEIERLYGEVNQLEIDQETKDKARTADRAKLVANVVKEEGFLANARKRGRAIDISTASNFADAARRNLADFDKATRAQHEGISEDIAFRKNAADKLANIAITNTDFDPLKEPKERIKKDKETIQDVLDALARQIRLLNQEQIDLGIDKSKEKISAIQSAIERLSKDFKVDPKGTIIQKLFGDINQIEFVAFGRELQANINNLKLRTSVDILLDMKQAQEEFDKIKVDPRVKPIKIPIEGVFANNFQTSTSQFIFPKPMSDNYVKQLKAFYERIAQINQDAADGIRKTLDNAFVSVGDSIAQSIGNGTNLAETIFGNLFKVIGAGLTQLGEAMVALGTAKIALEKFKFAPGVGTVLAGIAAIAIGQLFKNAIPGFADGVTNFSGGVALVGERGPELVRLPRGSDVIPNGRLGDIGGGGAAVIIPSITLRGADLVVAFNRANQTISRNG